VCLAAIEGEERSGYRHRRALGRALLETRGRPAAREGQLRARQAQGQQPPP
jgi:hypothetical protein